MVEPFAIDKMVCEIHLIYLLLELCARIFFLSLLFYDFVNCLPV